MLAVRGRLGIFFRKYHQRNPHISEKSNIILYGDDASPPVRFVKLTAAILSVTFKFHEIDLFKGDNRTDFYKKINPLQKVPVISINGKLTLWDSHAIALFLCLNFDHKQRLYPKDKEKQAKVQQCLYFNASVLFILDSEIYCDVFAGKAVDMSKVKKWYSALDHLENLLNKHQCLSGDQMQLCDVCCWTTITSLEILVPLLEKHVKIKKWKKKLENMDAFQINKRGIDRLRTYVDQCGPDLQITFQTNI